MGGDRAPGEIVDGATLGIPGLSGQVANVFTTGGAISGRYEWRGVWRPKYAKPSYAAGEISVSGSTSRTVSRWKVVGPAIRSP